MVLLCPCIGLAQTPPGDADVTDARVAAAARNAVTFLLSGIDDQGALPARTYRQSGGGIEAMVVDTAILAGVPPDDPRIQRTMAWLRNQPTSHMYTAAERTMVYARLGAPYQRRLQAGVAWLIEQQRPRGGWAIQADSTQAPNVRDTADVLRALQQAAWAGMEIPQSTWIRAEGFLRRCANADGGMGYQARDAEPFRMRGASNGPATAAGATALGVLMERYYAAGNDPETSPPSWDLYRKATDWLDRHASLDAPPNWYWGEGPYYTWLHALSLSTEATAPLGLGNRSYDRRLAELLLERQRPDGSFPPTPGEEDTYLATALATRILLRTARPVLLQRMTLPGATPARPDAIHLVRWMQSQVSLPFSWRSIPPKGPYRNLSEAPILYITGRGRFALSDAARPAMEAYLRNGGTVCIVPDGEDELFDSGAAEYFRSLSSAYAIEPLPEDHPLRTTPTAVPQIAVRSIGDASRKRIFLVDTNLVPAWSRGAEASTRDAFAFFGNLAAFATSEHWPTQHFDLQEPSARQKPPTHVVRIGRLVHGGDWQLGYRAAETLSRDLRKAYSAGVTQEDIQATRTIPPSLSLLWVTGTQLEGLRAVQRQKIRNYLARSGVLLADPGVGKGPFLESVEALMKELFGPDAIESLPVDSPLLDGSFGGGLGSDIRTVRYTPAAAKALGRVEGPPPLKIVRQRGRIVAVISELALSSPVEGTEPYDCMGYSRTDARRLALNVLLYAYAQQKGSAWMPADPSEADPSSPPSANPADTSVGANDAGGIPPGGLDMGL